MPDDVPEVEWSDEGPPTETAETAHDDIMKRLLDYQRSLREGASPEEAAEAMKRGIADAGLQEASPAAESLAELLSSQTVPDEEPELAPEPEPEDRAEGAPEIEVRVEELEPEPEEAMAAISAAVATDAAGGSRSELEARVGRLEGRLEGLGEKIAELRTSFQEMAIAADERLARMAEEVGRARGEPEQE